MVSLPAPPLMTSESLAPSAPAMVTCADRPLTTTDAPLVATLIVSPAAVPFTVTLSAAPSPWPLPGPGQVDGDLRHAGSREVVDHDVVGATYSIDLDLLDPVEVHGDAANVTGEANASPVGGDVHVLADVGTVEHEPIRASPTLDDVAAIARIPDERIVAVAEQGGVVATSADDRVVAVASEQEIGALDSR
jgi:hypothetical protein